jgi:subtilase family serine protease
MKTNLVLVAVFVLALFCFGCGDGVDGNVAGDPDSSDAAQTDNLAMSTASSIDWAHTAPVMLHGSNLPVCPSAELNGTRCHARVVVDDQNKPKASTGPTGYGPSQFRSAYNVSGTAAGTPLIAIVDAYDDPNILADLNTYSTTFGIPTMAACPTSPWPPTAPCFRKVDQSGGTSYPKADAGWALEISLDVEIAHAVCQNCAILLVEAKSAGTTDLMTAIDRARTMGAKAISNSWGGGESSSETSYDSHFNYKGIAFTVSSGDSGYGVEWPAASPYVTAVGGTTLTLTGGGARASETVWSGAGSGCSKYEAQPSFQTALGLATCKKRMVADVSADADPNTGAAVYDSVSYQGQKGWFQVGGTSLAAPLIAAIYALGGVGNVQANSMPYSLGAYTINLFDVISGSNGRCSPSYLCTGVAKYDGPSGLGTPIGATAV